MLTLILSLIFIALGGLSLMDLVIRIFEFFTKDPITIRYLIYSTIEIILVCLGLISIFNESLLIIYSVNIMLGSIILLTILIIFEDISPNWQYKEIFNKNK
jgi:flagellar biosynthesis protein FlhB